MGSGPAGGSLHASPEPEGERSGGGRQSSLGHHILAQDSESSLKSGLPSCSDDMLDQVKV